MIATINMLLKCLNLLAIPAGLEPATIGLEGPKPIPVYSLLHDLRL